MSIRLATVVAFVALFVSSQALAKSSVVSSYGSESGPIVEGFRLGAWNVMQSKDDFTDEISYTITWVGSEDHLAQIIPCDASTTVLSFRDTSVIEFDDVIDIKFRVDGNETHEMRANWTSGWAFILNGGPFVDEMLAGNKMIVQIGDGDVIRLSLEGTKEAWEHATRLCGTNESS